MITVAPLYHHVSSRSLGSSSGGSSGVGSGRDQKGGGPASSGSGGGGGDKKGGSNQLCCPKCGDPCTHVETFVCKYTVFPSWSLIIIANIKALLSSFDWHEKNISNISCNSLKHFLNLYCVKIFHIMAEFHSGLQ